MTGAPVLVVTGLAILAGCRFDAGFDGTAYRCGAGERCPPGQTCGVGGVCELMAAAPDAGATDGPDETGSDGGPPAGTPPCSSLLLLRDTFDGGGDGAWGPFQQGGATAAETGGQLVISLPAAQGYAGYASDQLYDLRSGALEVAVGQLSGKRTSIQIKDHLGRLVELAHVAGRWEAVVDGAVVADLPFVTGHLVWRIREAGGELYWEASANRTAWTEIHRGAAPLDVRTVQGLLMASGPAGAASQARFDDVNLPAPAGLELCSASALIDDFAAAPFAPQWTGYQNGTCTVTETGGAMIASYPGTGAAQVFCGVISRQLWKLTGGAVVMDAGGLPRRTSTVSFLQAIAPEIAETRVEMTLDKGVDLNFAKWMAGVIVDSQRLPFDPVAHRWWRMRGAGGQVAFDTSPNGTDWIMRYSVAPSFAVDRVLVNVGGGHYADTGGAFTLTVPGVNAP